MEQGMPPPSGLRRKVKMHRMLWSSKLPHPRLTPGVIVGRPTGCKFTISRKTTVVTASQPPARYVTQLSSFLGDVDFQPAVTDWPPAAHACRYRPIAGCDTASRAWGGKQRSGIVWVFSREPALGRHNRRRQGGCPTSPALGEPSRRLAPHPVPHEIVDNGLGRGLFEVPGDPH